MKTSTTHRFVDAVKLVTICLFLTIGLASCSSSGDEPQETDNFSFVINGETIVFDVLFEDRGATVTTFTGSSTSNPGTTLLFNIANGDTGTGAAFDFRLNYQGEEYFSGANNASGLISNVSVNNSERIQLTFSGPLDNLLVANSTIQITNGQFLFFF